MNIKHIHLLILFITAVLSGCKKEDNTAVANRAVVVAYLMPGQAPSVKIYQQKAFDDTSSYGALVSGLNLTLSNGSDSVSLQETATGTYTYSDASYIQTGKTYGLTFSYNNETVTATTTVPVKTTGFTASTTTILVPANDDFPNLGTADSVAVVYRWNNPDSLYHVLVFKNDELYPYILNGGRGNAPANFTINGKQEAGYELYYRTLNYKGTYKVILFTVNKEYNDVLSSNANTSSQQLTNPPGNISNGYGIFTAMQADTIELTVNQ
ncbi:DUF4249 domain-containing protein [Mucilaginibacter roseus]|uniref:DUF4249 domain-containing protein n=1 Tax=Mucilaginibacter roseus TaxID=1528868 RepID=A0ABS8U1U6_9SPHI|nr:DUF4249 family protein [Mucilaginibacter roseus]MCD8739734.1 DUF4249 domain-containing protein [Mucilaginibacter roseus]